MPARAENVQILHNRMQFLIGILMLVAGSLIYVTDRNPDYVYFTRFFGVHLKLFDSGTHLLGKFGGRLPAFFHVLSFSLITSAFMACGQKTFLSVCAGWFLINCGFELGQKYKLAAARITPDFFEHLPFFENTRAYFLGGTFDWLDIAAAATGAAVAYILMLATKKYHFGRSFQKGTDDESGQRLSQKEFHRPQRGDQQLVECPELPFPGNGHSGYQDGHHQGLQPHNAGKDDPVAP